MFAGIPFTVKSLAWTVAGCTGSVRFIMKSTGWVLMVLLQAGGTRSHGKTHQLSVGVGVLLRCAVDGVPPIDPAVWCLVSTAEP